jgi:hypothetical protein
MNFKPLVSEDEFRAAEADIEAATRELAHQAQAAVNVDPARVSAMLKPTQPPRVSSREIRTRTLEPSLTARLMASFGMRSRVNRVHIINKIAKTVDLACASGLAEKSKPFDMIAGLYAMACNPKTSTGELSVILGWVQAIVVMTCPSITPNKVRAI